MYTSIHHENQSLCSIINSLYHDWQTWLFFSHRNCETGLKLGLAKGKGQQQISIWFASASASEQHLNLMKKKKCWNKQVNLWTLLSFNIVCLIMLLRTTQCSFRPSHFPMNFYWLLVFLDIQFVRIVCLELRGTKHVVL